MSDKIDPLPAQGSDDGKSTEWRVRERAHQLWEHEGRPEGRHEDHWAQAEREVSSANDDKLDKASADSFPASDAPANTGITAAGRASASR